MLGWRKVNRKNCLNPIKISTTRKGYIGQEIVSDYLLRKNLRVYTPVVDDFGVDLLVEKYGKYTSIQVKYHTTFTNQASIQVRILPTIADWIATPLHINKKTKIIWYKNNRKTEKYTVAFAVNKPKNNQVKKINFYKNFLKAPF